MEQSLGAKYVPKKRTKEWSFQIPLLFALLVFWVLIILRDFAGFGVPRLFFTLFAAFCFFFLPENEDFALFLAMMPFSSNLSFNEITLVFTASFFLRRLNQKLPNFLLLGAAVLFIELYNVLAASGDVRLFLHFALMFLFGLLLVSAPLAKEHILKIVSAYIVSAVIVGLDVMYNMFSYVTMDEFFTWGYRLGRVSNFASGNVTSFDPNELAVFLLLGMILLTMLYYIRRVPFLVFLPTAATLLIVYAFTQSRGGLLIILTFFGLFWIGQLRNPAVFFRTSLLLIASVLIVTLLLLGPFSDLLDRFIYRFSVDDITSGRTGLWEQILEKQIMEPVKFFFGFGSRAYSQMIGDFTAHNTIMDIYASWGVIGIFLMLFWHISAVNEQRRRCNARVPIVYYAPFVAILVSAMGLQFYLVVYLSVLLSLSELAIRLFEFDGDRVLTFAQRRSRDKALAKALKEKNETDADETAVSEEGV